MVMKDSKIVNDVGLNFNITQGDKKSATVFHLRAESDRSKAAWIDALDRARVRLCMLVLL